MRKIKVRDYVDQQRAISNLEGFLEGRDKTVEEILRMHKSGKKPKDIIKYLKEFIKVRHEDLNK